MKAIRKNAELTDREYEEYLNEAYGTVEVCGYKYDSGALLKRIDRVAFDCGKNDLEDSMSRDFDEVWICGECGREFLDNEEAERCCQERMEMAVEEELSEERS